MTSQRQIEDEMLAKRLQSEEFRAAQGTPTRSPINQSDEELARRLAREENNPPATRVIIASSNNNRPTVKLHQTATGRQIGETLVVHSFTADEIALELSSKSGYYLRVRDTGAVEFNVPTVGYIDDFYRFRVFILSNGSCYLMNKAYLQSTNRIGGRGWHLTILPNGQLCGNGPRDSSAEWALLNLQTQLPLFHPATGYIASSSGVAPPPAPALSYQINQQPFLQSTQFPGLGAGKDELMRYFSTPTGVQFLTQSEYLPAYQLYQRNLLSRILHRPDWPFLASRFRDFLSEPVKFQQSIVDHFATKESLSQFFEQGWTMIPNVVTPDALNNARKIIQYWQFKSLSQAPQGHNGVKKGRGYSTELTGDVMIDFDLLSLYYMSPLPHIMEELMGVDEVDHPKFCRVTSVFPSLDLTESPALFGDKWTIEGFTSTPQFSHSPYNILVGVALTDIPDIDMGNFCIHPGSHVVLLEEYKKKAELRQTLFSENPYLVQKPDLGPPTQLKMKAGDAFFCTQRAATLLSANTRADPTIFAFFEVSHVDHAVMKDPALQSIWLEYKNASRYLKDENAGIIFAPAVVVSHDLLAAQYQTQRREEPLPDVSSVHVSTTASPVSTSVASSYPSATASAAPIVYTSSATSSSSVALNRSPSLTEEYAPATNPMFSSNTAGYSALPAIDDDDDRTSTGPIRPSNQIQLNTFPSGQRRKDGEHDLLL